MKYILIIFISIFIISCGGSSDDSNEEFNENINSSDIFALNDDFLLIDKLNEIRTNAGMVPLSNNMYLTNSSYNHAVYLDENHIIGHYEDKEYAKFTGVTPTDRTVYVGYKSKIVSENLSVGQYNEYFSLKGLMSAIYHRFGFLNFKINTIGYGKEYLSYVYNMGNIDLDNLCNGSSYEGHEYISACADSSFKISLDKYNTELNKTINSNPSYVIYPYNNEVGVTTSFYDESPDPLPSYGVSGYPISIEFNSNEYDMNNFSINSFIIYDDSNNVLDLAADYKDSNTILSKSNDVNGYFTEYQFAIFPKNRLEYNTHYNVKFAYTYNGVSKDIIWGFTTEKLENFIKYNNNDLNLDANVRYNIYIPPEDINDMYNRFTIGCTYSNNTAPIYDINFFDQNTISLKILGEDISSCSLILNKDQINEKNINVNIN